MTETQISMFLIIGLGNPGLKYKKTRHNIGFRILDDFQKENNFPKFKMEKKFNALISQGDKVLLAKPQTFMNESGKTVKALANFYKITNNELLVVHDDIDLPLGANRLSQDCGSAGHKGVESIIQELKTQDFARLRIGIQPSTGKPLETDRFVLQKFSKDEEAILKKAVEQTSQILRDQL